MIELPPLGQRGEQREGLDGLAETHVIGEHATQRGVGEERQPAVAGLLIGAQGGLQTFRQGARGQGVHVQRTSPLAPTSRTARPPPQRDEFGPQAGVLDAQPVTARLATLLKGRGFGDERPKLIELWTIEGEPGAGVEHKVILAHGEGAEEVREGNLWPSMLMSTDRSNQSRSRQRRR